MITEALCPGSSHVQFAGVQIQPHVKPFRDSIRSIIPSSFKWWVELDDDIGFSIRWIWMGNAAVSYVGRAEDLDPGILLSLISVVDWDDEVRRAIQSVEAYEAEALAIAQTNRRNSLIGSNLPRIEFPDPGPFSIEEKRRLARARFIQGIKYREFITEPTRILFQPTEGEIRNDVMRYEEDADLRRSKIDNYCISQGRTGPRLSAARPFKLPPFTGSKSSVSASQIEDMIVTASRRRKPLFTRKEAPDVIR
jgi:hypothetical protein